MNKNFLLISIFIIILLNVLLYSKTSDFDFVNYDDLDYVIKNESIQKLDREHIKTIFSSIYVSNYQPVSILSYAIDYKISKLDPGTYHITNTIIHILNSILVLLLIYMISGKKWTALAVALVFSLHPMQVESVAWISERKGLVCAFFYCLSFMAYIHYSQKEKRAFYFFSIILFVLSLLSKPMAITFPIILLLYDYCYDELNKTKLIEKAPYFALTGIITIIMIMTQQSGGSINAPKFSVLFKNFLFAFHNIGFYIIKLLHPVNLSVYYEYPENYGFRAMDILISVLVIAALILFMINFKKIKRSITFGILFFIITLVPILRIIPIGNAYAADKYMYLPIIGFFFAIALLFELIVEKKAVLKKAVFAGAAIYFAYIGFLSYKRLAIWENNYVFWSSVLKYDPDCYLPVMGLKQDYYPAVQNIAREYIVKKDYNRAREYYNLLLQYKRMRESATSYRADVSAFDALFPLEKHNKIKRDVLYNIGMTYLYENNLKEAYNQFTILTTEYPQNADGYLQLGNISDMSGDFENAVRFYNKSLELDNDNPAAHYNYAFALEKSGNINDAIKHYKLAVSSDSNWDLPRNALNRLLKKQSPPL